MPSFLTPYLFWIKFGITIIGLVAAFSGGMWLESTIADKTISSLKLAESQKQTADVTASLNQLQGFIATMHVAAADYTALQTVLFGKLDTLNKDFLNATKATPLPHDCRPDDVRVRALSTAISAANAAATGSIISTSLRPTP